jgi:SAM-dependent methyltransferase
MSNDIVELRDFYSSPLGEVVRRLLRIHIAKIWSNLRGARVVAIGYGTPLLRPLLGEAALVAAFMPGPQGVAYWPREGPNRAVLIENHQLPLADESIDRVILMHSLETSKEGDGLLREVWRVLKSQGRVLVIAPNRHGLWALSDRTPFGHGEPYSYTQLKHLMQQQGFFVDRFWSALYPPPTTIRFLSPLAEGIENIGRKLFPGLGGVILAEASKQLYAPLLTKKSRVPSRLLVPLPWPEAVQPIPSAFVPIKL